MSSIMCKSKLLFFFQAEFEREVKEKSSDANEKPYYSFIYRVHVMQYICCISCKL